MPAPPGLLHLPVLGLCVRYDALLGEHRDHRVRDLELLERYDGMVSQGMTRMGSAANLAAFEHQLRSILRRLARARVSSSMGWTRP